MQAGPRNPVPPRIRIRRRGRFAARVVRERDSPEMARAPDMRNRRRLMDISRIMEMRAGASSRELANARRPKALNANYSASRTQVTGEQQITEKRPL